MAEIRAQVAYHFKIDPAKLTPGNIRLPEQIIRTISAGQELFTEKVSPESIKREDAEAIFLLIANLVQEATRTAKPVASAAPVAPVAEEPPPAPKSILDMEPEEEELSAF